MALVLTLASCTNGAVAMYKAIAEGRRELLMSADGSFVGLIKASLVPWLDFLAPSVLDYMITREQQAMMSQKRV